MCPIAFNASRTFAILYWVGSNGTSSASRPSCVFQYFGVLEPLPQLGGDAALVVFGPVVAGVAVERVAVVAEQVDAAGRDVRVGDERASDRDRVVRRRDDPVVAHAASLSGQRCSSRSIASA